MSLWIEHCGICTQNEILRELSMLSKKKRKTEWEIVWENTEGGGRQGGEKGKAGRKEGREEKKEEGKREDCEEFFAIGLTFKNQSM